MSDNVNRDALSRMGILALVGPVIAISGISFAILLSPWFTWDDNALSDLGKYATAIPAAVVFNAGLISSGVIMLGFTVWFFQKFRDFPTKIGLIPLAVALVFLILIGILSEDFGDIHFVVSVGFFASFPMSMWVIGFGFLRFPHLRGFAIASIILPFFSLYMWGGWFGDLFPFWSGNAIPEITTALSVIGWIWGMWFHYYKKHLDRLLTK